MRKNENSSTIRELMRFYILYCIVILGVGVMGLNMNILLGFRINNNN